MTLRRNALTPSAMAAAIAISALSLVHAERVNAEKAPSGPLTAARIEEFKAADAKYVKALCGGPEAERNETRAARERLQAELSKAVADAATQSPEVQMALDVADSAGDKADKIATTDTASERDKAEAKAKFEEARRSLHDVAAKARARIEAQLADYGVALAPRVDCPDRPKVVEPKSAPKRAQRPQHRQQQRRQTRAAAPATAAAPAQNHPVVVIGGGGIGVGIGGGGFSIGR